MTYDQLKFTDSDSDIFIGEEGIFEKCIRIDRANELLKERIKNVVENILKEASKDLENDPRFRGSP